MLFSSVSVATYTHISCVTDRLLYNCFPYQLISNLMTETKSYSCLISRPSVGVIMKESLILAAKLTNRIVTYFLSVHSLQQMVPWTRTGILEAVWIDRSWLTSFSALRLPGPTVRVVFKFNVTDSCLCSSPIRRVSGGVNVLYGVESGIGKVLDDLGPSLSGQPVLSLDARVGLE